VSVRAMGFVKHNFFAPQVTHYEKTVMSWLADTYQDETGFACPSIAHLARWGIMSERQVQRSLRSLELKNIICPLPADPGRRKCTRYRFAALDSSTSRGDHQSPRGVTNGRRGVTVDTVRGDQACHTNSNELRIERTINPNARPGNGVAKGTKWQRSSNWPEAPSRDGKELRDRLTDEVLAVSKAGLWTDPGTRGPGSAVRDGVGG